MHATIGIPRIKRFAVLIQEVAGKREGVVLELVEFITQTGYQYTFVGKGRCAV